MVDEMIRLAEVGGEEDAERHEQDELLMLEHFYD
jgi:hypothetical protein